MYLGALTISKAYSLLYLHLERCTVGAPNTTSENLENTGQKKKYSGFFFSPLKILHSSIKAEAIKC